MIAKGSDNITIEDVRSMYPDSYIASKYLGLLYTPILINSPLREDRRPSFSIHECLNGDIICKDFSTGECFNIYGLLSKMWNISIKETLRRILDDLSEPAILAKVNRTRKAIARTPSHISVKVREWKNHDIEYWDSYGISLPWLKFGDIYPISHIILEKNGDTKVIPADKYAYVYVERKDNNITFKVYQPYSKQYKWMSKHDSSIWDLWTKIPDKGDNLIITSSRKDALAIWSNTGIPSLSLQGEGYIPKEHVVNELKERYSRIFILYDNDFQSEDNHGRIYGRTMAERFGLIQIEIPEYLRSKDASDLVKNYDRKTMREVIYSLINNEQIIPNQSKTI